MKKKNYIFEEAANDTEDPQNTPDEQEGEEDANEENEVLPVADSIDADSQSSENNPEISKPVKAVIDRFQDNLKQAFIELDNHKYMSSTIRQFSNGVASLIEAIFNEIDKSSSEEDFKNQVGTILTDKLPIFGKFCGSLIDDAVKTYRPSTEEDYSRILSDKDKIEDAIEKDEKLRETLITAMKQRNAEKRGEWNKQLSDPGLFDAIIQNFEKQLESAIKDSLSANLEIISNQPEPEPEPEQTSESVLYSNFFSREVTKSCSSLFESVLEMHSPKQLFVNRLNESISKNKSLDRVIKSREYKKLNKMGVPNSILSDYVEVYSDYLRSPNTNSLNETTKFGSEAIKKSIKSFFFESELDQRFIVKPTVAETIKDLKGKGFRIKADKDTNVYIATKDDITIFIPFCRIQIVNEKEFKFHTEYAIQKESAQEIAGKKYTFEIREFLEKIPNLIIESEKDLTLDGLFDIDKFENFLRKDLINFFKATKLGVKSEDKLKQNQIHKFLYENFSLLIYGKEKLIPKLFDLYYNKFSNNKLKTKEKFTISKIISLVEVFFPVIFNTQTNDDQIKELLNALSISKYIPGKITENNSDYGIIRVLIKHLQENYVQRSNVETYNFIYDNYDKFEKIAEILTKYEKTLKNFKKENKASSFWKRAEEISRELLDFEKSPVLQSINKAKESRDATEEDTEEDTGEEEPTEEEEKQKKDKKTNILRRIKRRISRDPRIKMPKEELDKVAKAVALRTASTVDAIVDTFVNKSIEMKLKDEMKLKESLVNNFSKKLTDSVVVAINNINNSSSILNEDSGINKLVNKIYTSDEVQNVIEQFNKDLVKYRELLAQEHPVTKTGTKIADPSKSYLKKSAERRLAKGKTNSSRPETTPVDAEQNKTETSDEQKSDSNTNSQTVEPEVQPEVQPEPKSTRQTEQKPKQSRAENSPQPKNNAEQKTDQKLDSSGNSSEVGTEANAKDEDKTAEIPVPQQRERRTTKVSNAQTSKEEKASSVGQEQNSNNDNKNEKKEGEASLKIKERIVKRIDKIKEGDQDSYREKLGEYRYYRERYIQGIIDSIQRGEETIQSSIPLILGRYDSLISAKGEKFNNIEFNFDSLSEKLISIILDPEEKDNDIILESFFLLVLLSDLKNGLKTENS